MLRLIILLTVFAQPAISQEMVEFFAVIQQVDLDAKTVVLTVDDDNIKFFKRSDKVYLVNELHEKYRCQGSILLGSRKQLKVKVNDFTECGQGIGFFKNNNIRIQSFDIIANMKAANEVVEILLKKKYVLENMIKRLKNDIGSQELREETINEEFEKKIQQVKLEQREALEAAKEKDSDNQAKVNEIELRIMEIDKRLELYNANLKETKGSSWSLRNDI